MRLHIDPQARLVRCSVFAAAAITLLTFTAGLSAAQVVPSPASRVMRPNDIPASTNLGLHAGNLGLDALLQITDGAARQRLADHAALSKLGFVIGAISAFQTGSGIWVSVVAKYATTDGASQATAYAANQGLGPVPHSVVVTRTADAAFASSRLVTLSSRANTSLREYQLTVPQGVLVYSVQLLNAKKPVAVRQVERVMRTLIVRQ